MPQAPTPINELRGQQAIQYASQNPGTPLCRRALLTGEIEEITIEVAFWLAQRGADRQVFLNLDETRFEQVGKIPDVSA